MFRNAKEVNSSSLSDDAKRQLLKSLNGANEQKNKSKYYEEKNDNRATDTTPDMERAFRCKPLGTKENPRFNSPVRIVVRTTRSTDTDNRAVSEKAVVDGLVKAGILKNDTKKWVKELEVPEPEISENEKTVIEIYEL